MNRRISFVLVSVLGGKSVPDYPQAMALAQEPIPAPQ
jgi:hypothetical protein